MIVIFNITNPMFTQVSVLEHGEDYTLGGNEYYSIKMDDSTYILTAALTTALES